MAMQRRNSPQPSTSARRENTDLSALFDDFNNDDDEWLNNVSLEDVESNPTNVLSQLNHSCEDFDNNSGEHWIFPIGYEKREYQLNISRMCLFTNTLVCLPTGLGKTFIASVVIYNFYRWFPKSKIIFMAPSRPLVEQQIEACYKVVGIPSSETAELTGRLSRDKRIELWKKKRLFFATPQVIQNDISDPEFPTDAIKLVIVDEAHKAKKKYSYCEVIKEISKVTQKFRVVALTATPGRTDDVIEIINNLLIAKIEVRTEKSPDVEKYVFEKDIEVVRVKLGELAEIRDRFLQIYDPYLRKLIETKAINGNSFSRGWIIMQWKTFQTQSHPQKTEINKLFSTVISLLHSLDLLERHGIQLFLNSFGDDSNVTKMKYFVGQVKNLKNFLDDLNNKYKDTSPLALNIHPLPNGEVPSIEDKHLNYGHPKYDLLKQKLAEYFNNGGTKAIIFCEYRETVAMVYTLLLKLRPTVMPKMLMGQSGAVSQKDQLLTMKEFRSNKVNVLVTTSVCEEGIDVGEVDLVVCFDNSSQNKTRFVQRIGRTGRKRKGKVLMLATEGSEEEAIKRVVGSKDNVNKIHGNKAITNSLYRNSPRLVPNIFDPKCIETKFNIPEVVVESKPYKKVKTLARKRKAEPETRSSSSSIAAHFVPAKKSSKGIATDDNTTMDEIQNVQVPDEVVKRKKKSITRFCTVRNFEQIKDNFLEDFKSVAVKGKSNSMLMTHINWKHDKDLASLNKRKQLFVEDGDMNDSITLDTSWKTLLDDSVNLKESSDFSSSRFESQEEQIFEVESRYANQLTNPETFNTPFKSSPFRPFNRILNTSSPQPSTSKVKKAAATTTKKTPIKDSPLLKAFQKQRNMSSSTPNSSRLVSSSFHRTSSLKLESDKSFQEKLSVPSSTSSLNQNASIDKETRPQMTAFEFFGITSIDDIFETDDSEDEPSSEHPSQHQTKPQPSPVEDSFSKLLEQDDDVFNNISFEDEVVESSVVDEVVVMPPDEAAKGIKVVHEKFKINLDDIFADSDESSEELEKNIKSLPDDLSQATQEYFVEPRSSASLMKENIQVVNSCIISVRPQTSHFVRPKPNFSKLLNLNALKPPTLPSFDVTTPFSNVLQDSSNLRNKPPESTSSSTNVPLLPSFRKKSPPHRPTKKKATIPKITKFLVNSSPSSVAPSTSRAANDAQADNHNESILISDDDEEKSPGSPAAKKVSRKRKRNNPFLDTQACVDGSDSSDDEGDLTTLDGFIANETIDLSHGEDTHAHYLQSIRSPSARQNGFKIPQFAPPMNRSLIFSQIPQHDDEDDWEMGSFVVNTVEDQKTDSEPDELEIAERRLKEMRKRANQRKNGTKRRKIVRAEDSSGDDELEEMRNQLMTD